MNARLLRRIAIALGALLLLAVLAAALLVATFDANRTKALASDWMREHYQRTLVIEGPVELSLLPRLQLKLSRVRLSEHGRPQDEFAAIDEAALAVQLLPLLRKQLVVDRVSARGVRAVYLRSADGTRNIDDLVPAKSAAAAPATPAPASGLALQFDVQAVQFDDLQLTLRDAVANVAGQVALQSFKSGRLAQESSAPVALRAAVRLSEPQPVDLALDGRLTLKLDLAQGDVAAGDLALALAGDIAGVKGLDAALTGALAWDGATLRADALHVGLKRAALGATVLAPSTLDLKRARFNPKGQRLELEALALALAGRQGADPFELSLQWPRLVVDLQSLQGSALAGRFKLAGNNALTGDFASQAPSGRFDALRLPQLAFKLAGSVGARQIDGQLKTDLLLDLATRAATLEALALEATLVDPGLQPVKLSLKGHADASAKTSLAHWQLGGTLNSNRFESQGEASLAGTTPRIQATARFDELDLNRLLAPAKGAAAAPPVAPAAAAPAATPVQLDALKAVDGSLDFAAGTLVLRQYRVGDAKVQATLDQGTLNVTRLTGRAWGGSIVASGSAKAQGPRIAVKLTADGVDVNALLEDVAGKDLLEGTGHVVADLSTSGASLGALRSRLAGSVALQVRNGAVKGINLAQSLRQAKAALALKKDALSSASSAEKTDFSELTASARIADGVASSDDLDLKSPFLRVRGSGRLDIGRGQIDYVARVSVVESARGQGGAELAALRGITVPVALTGPFDAIKWQIQWSGVAAQAIEQQLKNRLADELGKRLGGAAAPNNGGGAPRPRDELIDQLRGLFGK